MGNNHNSYMILGILMINLIYSLNNLRYFIVIVLQRYEVIKKSFEWNINKGCF